MCAKPLKNGGYVEISPSNKTNNPYHIPRTDKWPLMFHKVSSKPGFVGLTAILP